MRLSQVLARAQDEDIQCVYICQVEDWFSLELGYPYQPRLHGTLCEWLLQLVTTAFTADIQEPRTMTSVQDVQAAADAWTAFTTVSKVS